MAVAVAAVAVTGFYRLAQALIELDELVEAASAIEDGLRVDPGRCRAVGTRQKQLLSPF